MVASTNSYPLLSILNWLIPSLFVFWENQFVGRCNYTLNVPLRVLQVNKWWLRRKLITKWRSRTKLEKSFSLHTFCYISNNAVWWQFRQLWDVLCYHSDLKKKSEKVPVVLGRLCAQFSKNLSRLLLPSILSHESFVDSSCFRVFSIFLEIRTDFRKLTSVLCGDQNPLLSDFLFFLSPQVVLYDCIWKGLLSVCTIPWLRIRLTWALNLMRKIGLDQN